jgi:hypothetical protein
MKPRKIRAIGKKSCTELKVSQKKFIKKIKKKKTIDFTDTEVSDQ